MTREDQTELLEQLQRTNQLLKKHGFDQVIFESNIVVQPDGSRRIQNHRLVICDDG